jgi:mersacidin/lichenicidin family type 2 lantibiotic
MSIQDIIRAWKAEDDDEKDGRAPANPAGEMELSDEDLGLVGGGVCNDTGIVSCPPPKPTSDFQCVFSDDTGYCHIRP